MRTDPADETTEDTGPTEKKFLFLAQNRVTQVVASEQLDFACKKPVEQDLTIMNSNPPLPLRGGDLAKRKRRH